MQRLLQGLQHWKAKCAFKRLPKAQKQLVFYAEDEGAWKFLGPIVEELAQRGRALIYLTSSPTDPILESSLDGVSAFCIGEGTARTALFLELEAQVMVMTMPDLETFHIKRSRVTPVHYLYVPHSMVSTHMIFRPAAFDHFDTILCVGPHHVEEIRAREELLKLPAKSLVEHGYGPLDTLRRLPHSEPTDPPQTVLIAPSWGPHCILESLGRELVEALLGDGFSVIVRPHPRTRKLSPGAIEQLVEAFASHDRFTLRRATDFDDMVSSDVMISDWSGVALEYAFGLQKPVIFIDLPRKVNNPDYQRLGLEPLEVSIRESIGEVISPQELGGLAETIRRVCSDRPAWMTKLAEARERNIFEIDRSAEVAADTIVSLLEPKG